MARTGTEWRRSFKSQKNFFFIATTFFYIFILRKYTCQFRVFLLCLYLDVNDFRKLFSFMNTNEWRIMFIDCLEMCNFNVIANDSFIINYSNGTLNDFYSWFQNAYKSSSLIIKTFIKLIYLLCKLKIIRIIKPIQIWTATNTY